MGISVKLGKIMQAEFGFGGYNEGMIGLSITLSGKDWLCSDFIGFWYNERSPYAQWSEQDQTNEFARIVHKVSDLLKQANISNVDRLTGVPVEVTFSNNTLHSWRILTEVI
jgi:hypothetical protein